MVVGIKGLGMSGCVCVTRLIFKLYKIPGHLYKVSSRSDQEGVMSIIHQGAAGAAQ